MHLISYQILLQFNNPTILQDERVRSEAVKVTKEGGEFHLKGNDEMVNDAEMAELMKFKQMCASGECKAMPSKQKMQIKVKISVIYIKT